MQTSVAVARQSNGELVQAIENSMNFGNDLNYSEFQTKKDATGEAPLQESQIYNKLDESMDALDKQMEMPTLQKSTVVSPQEEEIYGSKLIKYGRGEIENAIARKILASVNIMKKPDQLLGFVPSMGGVYQSSNSTYGSGRIAHS